MLLVLLRLSIGWQLLYEGLWKFNEQKSSQPWSAEGFLKNSEGPFRDTFRGLTGDPDDRQWLDYGSVNASWDDWRNRFVEFYGLDESQTAALDTLLSGSAKISGRVQIEQLPPDVDEALQKSEGLKKALSYDKARKVLVVDGEWHLLPNEVKTLKDKAPVEKNAFGIIVGGDKVNQKFHEALDDVYERQAKLGYREKLRAMLAGNSERLGPVFKDSKGNVVEQLPGEHEKYFERLADYEKLKAEAALDFDHRHLDFYKRRLQELRSELVGPVKALDGQMKEAARKLLTSEQIARGPVSAAPTEMSRVNHLTIWLLLTLGTLLLCGFGTRIAAVLAAGMLLSFYLAFPPWPGVPSPGTSPEHSLFVDKNLIEVFALLAIAALPTGSWFGIDGLIYALFRRRKVAGDGGVVTTYTRSTGPKGDVPRAEPQKVTSGTKT